MCLKWPKIIEKLTFKLYAQTANLTNCTNWLQTLFWGFLNYGDINKCYLGFTNKFLEYAKHCIIRPNHTPWFDSEIRKVNKNTAQIEKGASTVDTKDLGDYKKTTCRKKVNNCNIKKLKTTFCNNIKESSIHTEHSNKQKYRKLVKHFATKTNAVI